MKTLIIGVLAVLWAGSTEAQAEDHVRTKVVVAVGSSMIYREDVSSARKQATANSLVSAVSQVSSDLIPRDTMVQDFHVLNGILYSRTNEYIRGYRVLSAARSGKRYSVMVEAEVLVEKMETQMAGVGIMLQRNALPRVLLFITEQDLSDAAPKYWWGADSGLSTIFSESMMAITMQEKGFSILDHEPFAEDMVIMSLNYRPALNKQEVLSLGAHFQADLVVLGSSVALEAANRLGDTMRSYSGSVSARVLRVDSGALIASTNQSFTAVSESPATGGADALAGAGRLAAADLIEQITAAWQKKLEGATGIEVLIRWSGNLANLIELRTAMASLPSVKRILPRSMNPKEAVVAVDFEGSERELADALMVYSFSSFGIHIFELSENHMSIEISP